MEAVKAVGEASPVAVSETTISKDTDQLKLVRLRAWCEDTLVATLYGAESRRDVIIDFRTSSEFWSRSHQMHRRLHF